MLGRHASRWLVAALGLILPFVLHAQTAPTDWVTAKSVTPIGPSGGVYLGQGNFIANGKYIPAGYYGAPIRYEAATIAKLVGKVAANTIRVAAAVGTVMSIYDLAKYLWNPTTNQWESGSKPATTCSSGYSYYNDIGGTHQSCGAAAYTTWFEGTSAWTNFCWTNYLQYTSDGQCTHSAFDVSLGCHPWTFTYTPGPVATSRGYHTGTSNYQVCVSTFGSSVTDPAVPGTAVPVADVASKVWNDPQLMHDLLHDPEGNIIRTPEVKAAEDALGSQLASKYGAPTAPSTAPATDVDPGVVINQPKTQTAPDQMPVFCEWAKTICDWIGWTKQTPTDADQVAPPVPFEDAPSSSTWSSGLGGGSCPAPHTVDLGDMGTFQMTVQPLCDLADYLRPLFIAMAALAAAFIIGGRRNAS